MNRVNSFNFEIFAQMNKVFNSLFTLYNTILPNFPEFPFPKSKFQVVIGLENEIRKYRLSVPTFLVPDGPVRTVLKGCKISIDQGRASVVQSLFISTNRGLNF